MGSFQINVEAKITPCNPYLVVGGKTLEYAIKYCILYMDDMSKLISKYYKKVKSEFGTFWSPFILLTRRLG